MNNRIKILDLGRMDYKPSWDFQKNFHQDVLSGKENDTLILVEHEPVYTLGRMLIKNTCLIKAIQGLRFIMLKGVVILLFMDQVSLFVTLY